MLFINFSCVTAYLYAGNWEYYFSGAWVRQYNQPASLFSPGFYLFGEAIHIPKLFAVPMVLAGATVFTYLLGLFVEKQAKVYSRLRHLNLSPNIIRHRIYTVSTFGVFNFFFVFGGRPLVLLLPLWIQYIYSSLLVLLSMLWLYKTWLRSPNILLYKSTTNIC
ncbi:hypothetical protein [Nostoc sp. MS1]|uniref:hypothetical protein n=1 Tax=Nostoc sp. MS1 TaxID=2764711 RepID=UPI001CC3D1C7|nr:hypothetical protein [Nostoc sp. MS1]BCL36964.1 hypothetical protein NSMS1_34110 [Nostoc sp. MS1]